MRFTAFACWALVDGRHDPLGYVCWAQTREEAEAKARAKWGDRYAGGEWWDGIL